MIHHGLPQEATTAIKDALRQNCLTAMASYAPAERQALTADLEQQLLTLIRAQGYRRIGLYYGVAPEVATPQWFETLLARGCQLYLPRVAPGHQLDFCRYHEADQLVPIFRGIYQPAATAQAVVPEDLDLVVVPGVVFRADGHRIGFGGGYYDRFLARYQGPTVSLALPCQYRAGAQWPVTPYDRAVDHILLARPISQC